MNSQYLSIVIGGGPAGLAAALKAAKGGKVLLIEREERLGGILKQCIHDGFGVVRFNEKLSGPEYAKRFTDEVINNKNIDIKTLTFVISIKKEGIFYVETTSNEGIKTYTSDTLIFACGCRERTARQVSIHGTRPAGLLTAGTAQNYVNLLGYMPTKKCIILGSGDIGLIMARRLTLEGAKVLGVYEAKDSPSGLTRNIHQCLYDFDIPLHLSKTVTRVFGNERVESAEIMSVDANMNPIEGTEQIIECDAVIVSVGLIPENELSEQLNLKIDSKTKGPVVDQNMMTSLDGVYSCGNALHVHDLVDYVSECAEISGNNVSENRLSKRELIDIDTSGFLYMVPQKIDVNASLKDIIFYFRSVKNREKAILKIFINDKEILKKSYNLLKPPEMERLKVNLDGLTANDKLKITLEDL